MKERARNLRKNQTEVETKLWSQLRSRRFSQFKFRRQRVFSYYIVDFVCLKRGIIVELDGGQHLENVEYDKVRTEFLNSLGFTVLRFWNKEILADIDQVLNAILLELVNNHPVLRTTFSRNGRRKNNLRHLAPGK